MYYSGDIGDPSLVFNFVLNLKQEQHHLSQCVWNREEADQELLNALNQVLLLSRLSCQPLDDIQPLARLPAQPVLQLKDNPRIFGLEREKIAFISGICAGIQN